MKIKVELEINLPDRDFTEEEMDNYLTYCFGQDGGYGVEEDNPFADQYMARAEDNIKWEVVDESK